MPRRGRNAGSAVQADLLAAGAAHIAPHAVISDVKYPCRACRRRGHWNGDYCPVCKVRIVLSARNIFLARR